MQESNPDSLPDRQYFRLNNEQWEAFQAALNSPPRAMPRLEKLLREPSVFDARGIDRELGLYRPRVNSIRSTSRKK
jgi:hypothetical protein